MSDPMIENYPESRSIVEHKNKKNDTSRIIYNGNKIAYQEGFTRVKFVDSIGDELVKENGELLRGECCGHIQLEVWGNYFTLNIETAFGDVVELSDMPIRMLKKLNKFLSFAIDSQPTLNDPSHKRR